MNTPAPATAPAATARPPLDDLDAPPSVEEIDISCRLPVVFLSLSAAAWLVFGLILAMVGSIQMHVPGFFSDTPALTVGRVRPVASTAILYGFASQAAIAVALWLLCRLGGNRLVLPRLITLGGAIWNAGVTLGVLGIFAGASTGFEWLEMPRFTWPILFVAYLFMGVSALVAFHGRRRLELYPAHWFLVAALFWFPWVYSASNLLLLHWPVRGVIQALVDNWFAHTFLWIWLGFIGLAAIFYFVPKLLVRPLLTWSFTVFAFWLLLLFTAFGSAARLTGGPVPAWISSIGIAANLLVAAGAVIVAIVWHSTATGAYAVGWNHAVLRFIMFSGAAWLVSNTAGILMGLREVTHHTGLTYAEVAQRQLAIHGFVGMALFGSLYYILPRVLRRPWPAARLVSLQFWLFAGGTVLVFLALGIGGLIQGARLNDPAVPILAVARGTIPFVGMATLGYFVLFTGAAVFFFHFLRMLKEDVRGYTAAIMREVRS